MRRNNQVGSAVMRIVIPEKLCEAKQTPFPSRNDSHDGADLLLSFGGKTTIKPLGFIMQLLTIP